MRNHDEDIPVTSNPSSVLPELADVSSVDEGHFDTLMTVRREFRKGLMDLKRWSAFDLEETDNLTVTQQIVAHRLAYDMLAPLLETVESSIAAIDAKYRES